MSRWLPVVARIVFLLIVGIVLFYAPWRAGWDTNFFLSHYPWLSAVGHNDFVRGAISGVGLADLWLAAAEFRIVSRPPHAANTR